MKKLYLLIMLACIPFSLFSQGSPNSESTDIQYKGDSCIIDSDDPVWTQDETNVYFHWRIWPPRQNYKCDYDFDFDFTADTRYLNVKKSCADIKNTYTIDANGSFQCKGRCEDIGNDYYFKTDDSSFGLQLPCEVDEKAAYMTHESDSCIIITLPKK